MAKLDDELFQELLVAFHDEALEHIATVNQSLLQIERGLTGKKLQKQVKDAFRAAHSLKGAARAVSYQEVETLSDGMESILQLARDSDLELDADTCDVLYDTLDAIQKVVDGKAIEVEGLQKRLSEVLADEASEEEQSKPSKQETPTSLMSSNGDYKETDDDDAAISSGDETIRVSVTKLDDLIAQVGELLVSKINAEQRHADVRSIQQNLNRWSKTWRELDSVISRNNGSQQLVEIADRHANQVHELAQSINNFVQILGSDTLRLGMVTEDLQDKVRRVRMVAFQTIVLGLQRVVRDAAHSENKEVTFDIRGQDVELDKKILESLKDPLLHLLRNAVSHGIEKPAIRTKDNKLAQGTIALTVNQRGSEVHIRVTDDGRGFDLDALRDSVKKSGQIVGKDASQQDIIDLAFLSGVTTASNVTAISGRGVGLDVVRQQLETVQGRIEVENNPGNGVSINLIVPTSLAMTRELMLQIGGETYGLPLQAVEKILEPQGSYLVGGKPMLDVDGVTLPLVSLAAILERPHLQTHVEDTPYAIVVAVADQRLALLVDNVLTEQELAVKTLGWPLQRVRNISGVALLGDGQPVFVLNPVDIVRSANHAPMSVGALIQKESEDAKQSTHVLVVDDSITTRTLEKNILQAAGYTVTIATNGVEALQKLKGNTVEIVVSDIQMPDMDGFVLTRTLKESSEHSNLPVILVTSLESQQDREQGMLAGADAYIVKRGFDQAELLTTIQQLLFKG